MQNQTGASPTDFVKTIYLKILMETAEEYLIFGLLLSPRGLFVVVNQEIISRKQVDNKPGKDSEN